jgi:hypothetical protein
MLLRCLIKCMVPVSVIVCRVQIVLSNGPTAITPSLSAC